MKIFQVDSFTDRPFRGNPAAVCLVEDSLSDELMQYIAAEMNLSETAFVEVGVALHGLRWFTPTAEVDLCGHATLAAAHVLYQTGTLSDQEPAKFHTRSGELRVHREGEQIVMDFPARPSEVIPVTPAFESMVPGSTVLASARDRYNLILELPDERAVREAEPDMERIAEHSDQGVIITGPGRGYDFVSRFFGPNVGVPEDPVTGSAHCQLAPYWTEKLAKTQFTAFQASQRGGRVLITLEGDRCLLKGHAVTVFEGNLMNLNVED